jgi:hypothetical protein
VPLATSGNSDYFTRSKAGSLGSRISPVYGLRSRQNYSLTSKQLTSFTVSVVAPAVT